MAPSLHGRKISAEVAKFGCIDLCGRKWCTSPTGTVKPLDVEKQLLKKETELVTREGYFLAKVAVFQDLWGHRFEFDKDYVWIDSSSCISDCLIIEFFKWISSRILCEDSQACYFPSHYSGNTEATTKRVMGERVRKDSVKRYWGEWEKWDIHVLKGEAKENLDARGS